MSSKRYVSQSPLHQGPNESIAYLFNWTNVGTPAAAGTCKLYNADGDDLSSTNQTGSPSLSGDVVTSPAVHSLTAGSTYYLVSQVSIDSNTIESILKIITDPR